MTRFEFFSLISRSLADSWTADEVPTECRGAENDHHKLMVLNGDLDVSIAYGAICNADYTESWVEKFADPKASSVYVDFRYRGAVIDRQVYVCADGGRRLLPMLDFDPSSGGWSIPQNRLYIPTLLFSVHCGSHADLATTLENLNVQIV